MQVSMYIGLTQEPSHRPSENPGQGQAEICKCSKSGLFPPREPAVTFTSLPLCTNKTQEEPVNLLERTKTSQTLRADSR